MNDREPDDAEHEAEQARARQVEVFDAVGRLAGGLAHDFNNLLATILGYAEFLESQLKKRSDAEAERNDLQEITTAAERARELTQRLLAFAQRTPHRPSLVELQQIVLDLEKTFRRLAPPTVTCTVELPASSGVVYVDRAHIDRALLCLAVNGLDAMPGGGRLDVRVERYDLRERALPRGVVVGHQAKADETYLAICVRDSGKGMSADYIRTAFQPYATTKSGQEIGEGLGLAVAYGAAMKANGLLVIDSVVRDPTAPGTTDSAGGTAVYLLIPQAQATAAMSASS